MKPLSEHARKLIEDLQQADLGGQLMLPAERRKGIDAAVELIRGIEKTGEWSAVPYLCLYLTSTEKYIADAAASAVEFLIGRMRPKMLLQMDERLRGGRRSLAVYLTQWNATRFKDLERSGVARRVDVIGLASFHHSGYVRESAVVKLRTIKTGHELPFLLIRLADWVVQVRQVAEAAVAERISGEYAQHLIESLPLLDVIKHKQRVAGNANGHAIVQRITDMLQEPAQRKALMEGLRNSDQVVRRECVSLIKPRSEAETSEILEILCRDKDVTNRRTAIALCTALSQEHRQHWFTKLFKDPAPGIRRDALVALIDLVEHSECQRLLRNALMDSSGIVRDFARWKIEKLGLLIDLRQVYVALLASQDDATQLAAAIAGLGEVGSIQEAEIVLPFVESKSVRVRKAAVRTIARLDGKAHIELFVRLLADRSAGVSMAASNALESFVTDVNAAALWRVFDANEQWHVKRNTLRLLNQIGKWERISYLLAAAAQSDLKARELALQCGEGWAREFASTWNYSKPEPEEKARIQSAMDRLSNELPAGMRKILGDCLKEWGVARIL